MALTMTPQVGGTTARTLIDHCGSIEEIFNTSKKALCKIPRITENIANDIVSKKMFQAAELEWQFIQENDIQIYFYTEPNFPKRLKDCKDAPILFFFRGKTDFNQSKTLAIIGTRNATDYGKDLTHQIVKDLAQYQPLIVSGLAYGIDIAAHKAALHTGLETVGVLGQGLDAVYPAQHTGFALQMMEQGGILSEFKSYTKVDRGNFPSRNRIVAGLSDAILVVQTAEKGGSMITARQGHAYHREILAIPARVGDEYGKGCNTLIKKNIATLVESAEDIAHHLGWNRSKRPKNQQQTLFVELSPQETKITNLFKESNTLHKDELNSQSPLGYSETAAVLLTLELKGLIKILPGNQFKLLL